MEGFNVDMYTEEMLEQIRKVHSTPKQWAGSSILHHLHQIKKVVEENNITTILDYGCGKARYHPKELNITKYDPGVIEFSEKPLGKFDMVMSTDVLEHVEEEFIVPVLDEIFNYATKFVFLSICIVPAKKILPDGRNAHVTVKPKEWWEERLSKYSLPSHVSYDGNWRK